jgi:hypothetical protein
VCAAYFIVDVTRDRLDRISAMAERGPLHLPIGEVLDLADASTAHRMLDRDSARRRFHAAALLSRLFADGTTRGSWQEMLDLDRINGISRANDVLRRRQRYDREAIDRGAFNEKEREMTKIVETAGGREGGCAVAGNRAARRRRPMASAVVQGGERGRTFRHASGIAGGPAVRAGG